jgi:hypothetical protein
MRPAGNGIDQAIDNSGKRVDNAGRRGRQRRQAG